MVSIISNERKIVWSENNKTAERGSSFVDLGKRTMFRNLSHQKFTEGVIFYTKIGRLLYWKKKGKDRQPSSNFSFAPVRYTYTLKDNQGLFYYLKSYYIDLLSLKTLN